MNLVQEPGQLEGEVVPQMGIDGPETVCEGHDLRNEAGGSRYLRTEGHRGREETVRQRVCVGASDTGVHRGVGQADGPSCPYDRRTLGGDFSPLGSRADKPPSWRVSTARSRQYSERPAGTGR